MSRARFLQGAAFFFLLLTPVWIFWIAPALIALPDDFSFTAKVISIDNFYDERQRDYSGEIYSKTTYRYETVSSDRGVSVIKNIFDVRTPNDEPVFSAERLYGIDRKTGEHVEGAGDRDREGYLFAPRHLKKGEPFTYWHINYDGPARMTFVGEEYLYGLRTFRYETRYEGVTIDQTENLKHLRGVGVTRGVSLEPHLELWIEPATGRLVKYRDDTVAFYYDLGTKEKLSPWNHFSNVFDEESVRGNIVEARKEKAVARIVEWYIPAFFVLLSAFFFGRTTGLFKKIGAYIPRRKIPQFAGVVVALVASAALVGWLTSTPFLTRPVPYADAMNPVTALSFILLSLGILLSGSRGGKISAILGLVVAMIGILRLLETIGILPFSVDLILFREAVLSADIPARMAQYTALSLFLLGLIPGSIFWGIARRAHFAEITSSVVFILSISTLAIFLFELAAFISLPNFFSASVPTTVLFVISSAVFYALYRETEEYTLPFKTWLFVVSALFLALFGTVAIAGFVDSTLSKEARVEFLAEVNRTAQAITDRMGVYTNVLQGAHGLLDASEQVSRGEWKSYVESLSIQTQYPGIQGIGYSIFIRPEQLAKHIAAIRAEGFPDYTVRPPGKRDLYSSIIFIEPFDVRNQRAFGFDMFQEPVRRAAMEQARDTGIQKISGRVTLVQETATDIQPGFLVYVPVYGKGRHPLDVVSRRNAIIGYAYSPFRARDFFDGILGKSDVREIALAVHDGAERSEENLLYDDAPTKLKKDEQPRFTETRPVFVNGRLWTLTFRSTATFGETLYTRLAIPAVIVIGIFFSLLIAFSLYTVVTARQRAVTYADKATLDLQAAIKREEERRRELEQQRNTLEIQRGELEETRRAILNILEDLNVERAKVTEEFARSTAVLLGIGDAVFAVNASGTIILFNPIAEELSGYSAAEVIGTRYDKFLKFLPEEATKKPDDFVERALAGTRTTMANHTVLVQKSGARTPVADSASPILDAVGNVVGAVVVFRDVTKERAIDRAKSEFVSLASHQLRTPISAINWYTELLEGEETGKLNKTQKSYLGEIARASRRMADLVNALLNVSRLELGTFSINPKPMNVIDVVKEVVQEEEKNVFTRKQNLEEQYDKGVPVSLNIDRNLFRIVAQNLISNAIKYTPPKGTIKVSLSVNKKEGTLRFVVSDTGAGIPRSVQGRIFTKLFRADNARTIDPDGNGLGLYIIKSIMENAGGKTWFESVEGKGSTFYVEIPLSGMKAREGTRSLD